MFSALKCLTDSVTLNVILKSEGDNMRVIVMPDLKECKNPALATPLVLVASPKELDAGFTDAVREYAEARSSLATSLADSVADAKKNMTAAAEEAGNKGKPEKSVTAAKENVVKSHVEAHKRGRKKSQELDLFSAAGKEE